MEKFMTFLGFAEEVDEDGTEGGARAAAARGAAGGGRPAAQGRGGARRYAEESRGEPMRTVWWEAGTVRLLDQTRLPGETTVRTCRTWEDVADAIRRLQGRGGPALGGRRSC